MATCMTIGVLLLSLILSGCFLSYDIDTESLIFQETDTDIQDDSEVESDENESTDGDTASGLDTETEVNDTATVDSEGDPSTDPVTDQCPFDDEKTEPGQCGCGIPDKDSDLDETPDCIDDCPEDPDKTEPGECGCGVEEGDCLPHCAEGEGRRDPKTQLCWQAKNYEGRISWSEAVAYCETLSLGGGPGWRLPTRGELIGILGDCDENVKSGDNGYCNPCAYSSTCMELFRDDSKDFWSSTIDKATSRFWIVLFETGFVRLNDAFRSNRVRCVRP